MILTNQTSMQHKKGQTGRKIYISFLFIVFFANIELEANRKLHYTTLKTPPPLRQYFQYR